MGSMTKLAIAGLISSVAIVSQANAGGFNRGSANLDGLYSDGIGIYTGVTYVNPGRSYSSVSGLTVLGGTPTPFTQSNVEFGGPYTVPYFSVGGRLMGDVSCVASYSRPYGADSDYTGEITYHIAQQSLATDEFGLTCSYGMDVGKGRLSLIGGGFYEQIEYNQARNFNRAFGNTGNSTIKVKSNAWGYRLGVAYEIKEIALRGALMYRSQTDHNATGNYGNTPFTTLAVAGGTPAAAAAAVYGAATSATATASASLPQQVELSLQSGIAPGWLAFGSIKWTDWSVLQRIQLVEGIAGSNFSTANFFFQDGWTVTGGIGHKFNDNFSGAASVTWDRGVTSGWDTLTDVWSFTAGGSYAFNENVSLRFGGAAIYLTSGQKTKTSSVVDYTATSPAEWGYAVSGSFNAKF